MPILLYSLDGMPHWCAAIATCLGLNIHLQSGAVLGTLIY